MSTKNIFNLNNKICVVTGGSRGLGREMCQAFAENGARGIVIASRKIGNCQTLAKEIMAKFPSCKCVPAVCNVSSWDSCNALYETTMKEFDHCDVLVNNAGGSPLYPSLVDIDEKYFDKIMNLNFKGPFRLSTLFATKMCTQDNGGSIINVSTAETINPNARATVYGAAKSALNYYTKAIAVSYGPKVRCNCIMPGPFLTDISKAWDIKAMEPGWKTSIALQRAGRPEEIIGAALYFASDASSYTTGSILEVHGGSFGGPLGRDPRFKGNIGKL